MKVERTKDKIVLRFGPLESLVSLKRKIEIPLSSIKSIKYGDVKSGLAIRFPGTWIPGILRAGTYWRWEGGRWVKEFWFRPAWGKAITIELRDHEYKRIVIKTKSVEKLKREIVGS